MTQTQAPSQARAVAAFVLVTLIWGSTWLVIKDQISSTVPTSWAVTWRFVVAAAGMFALALVRRERLPAAAAQGLQALLRLYGDRQVLAEARRALSGIAGVEHALDDMAWLAEHLAATQAEVDISFDLADLRGYAYYSGTRFAIYGQGAELVRGGRYDEVGAVFGRKRPAAGFSLDLKELVAVLPARPLRPAIRAPWGEDAQLRQAIARLRADGHTVACVLPGHEHEVNEFDCDRELCLAAGQWVVQALDRAA